MSMQAAAVYFRVLRNGRGLSRAALAARLGVSEMSIWRIEEEGQEPKAELLMSLIKGLQGSAEHVYYLLTQNASEEEGKQLAEAWLTHAQEDLRKVAPDLTEDERLRLLIATAEELQEKNPSLLERLIGFALGLAQAEPAAAPGEGDRSESRKRRSEPSSR